jgi:hypothetical protein
MSGGFPAPSDGSIPATIVNGVDQIRLTQYHYMMYGYKYFQEITRGIAYGTEDSKFTTSGFLDITLANAEQFAKEEYQQLQTLIANKNLLIASGTANAITLSTRVIDDTPESGTYAKNAPLPLSFRDGLELDFVATANNTGAVTMSIPSFQGVSGALDIIKQDLTPLIQGEIKIGYRYTIICDQTNNRFILKNSFFRGAATTTQGIAYLNKPIVLTYNSPTVVLYSAGTFQFDDGSDSGVLSAGSVDLATNGIGGLDTGSLAINTTYFQHAYKNNTTGAFGTAMSTSPTTSTISGWTRVARIRGAVLITNGSSQIIQGTWYKDGKFILSTPLSQFAANGTTTATLYNLTVPVGIKVSPLLVGNLGSNGLGGVNRIWLISSPDSLDVAPTSTVFSIRIQQGSQELENDTVEMSYTVTNTLGQIRSRTNTTSCTTTMVLFGWIDNID